MFIIPPKIINICGGGAFGSIMCVNRCNNTCDVVFTYSSYSNVVFTTFQFIDVVKAIYSNQCYETTSIGEFPAISEYLTIYPNPSIDYINLQFPNVKSFKAYIYNLNGLLVKTHNF